MANEVEIKKMKRGELNEFAAGIGLNPDDYSRADELRSAIFKQTQEQEASAADQESPEETDVPVEATEESKPKVRHNPPRPQIERRSKRYRSAHEKVERLKEYELTDAVKLAQETSNVKFDATVELHVNLGVDPKQSDQLVRGTIVLPHGTGKSQKVAAIAPESEHDKLKKAGADTVGYQDLLESIGKGELDFDILVAHPDVMRDLSKQAKVLGPKGLMPSPKAGTVTDDPAKVVKELKGGRIEFRVDRYGIIHQSIGKVSFKPEQLIENAEALLDAVKGAKPSSSKGVYMRKVSLSTSMGPSIQVQTS